MSSITVQEIKDILQLSDSWVEKDTVTFASVAYSRIAHKGIAIHRVDTSTGYTTGSAYSTLDYYTTKDYRDYTLIRRIDTGTISDTETVYIAYSYSDYTDMIETLLPQVEADVCNYLNNYFEDDQTEYASGDFKLIARSGSSHPCITDTANQEFVKWGFATGMDITVSGTCRNNGIYHISNAAAAKLKLSSNDTLIYESSTVDYGGQVIQINRIKWPPEIKKIIASLIWQSISRAKDQAITSKSLGPSSVSYAPISSGGYAPSLVESLNKFKNAKVI